MTVQAVADRLWSRFEKELAASPFAASLLSLAAARKRFQSGRPLTQDERHRLESQGNTCADWSRVRLESKSESAEGLENIRNNQFEGDVLLTGFRGEWPAPGGRTWPAGMANCRVRDAVIGNACLYNVIRLERQVIEDGAVLVGVGDIDCPAPTLFSLGLAIHPGSEAATRTVWLRDTLTLGDCVDASSLPRPEQKDFQARLDRLLASYRCEFGYVGRGAAVVQARHVHAAWIGPGSIVTGASRIREAALLSAEGEPCVVGDEGWIEHAMLHPGARVESGGKVSRSMLLEHAEVAWGGMVSQSVIGPNTHVAKGEITASLLGPFVGFHHQALLISALWPEGIGNIGYGANVGSNHTGKKPDQEIRPGEGNFFGLGCSVKFPANFEDSPYSLFATGVVTLPQRLAFPFSLILQPMSGVSELGPAINEILPGWMWSDNAYALVRRSYKLIDSDKARRHKFMVDPETTLPAGFFTGRVFAPEIARRVIRACRELAGAPKGKDFLLEEDVPGLGKNFLRTKKLAASIAAYQDYLVFYLLRTYADRPRERWNAEVTGLADAAWQALAATGAVAAAPGAADGAREASPGSAQGGAAAGVSRGAGPTAVGDPRAWLATQLHRLTGFRDSLKASLARDDKRGRQIFDDYADFNDAPESDSALARLDQEVTGLLGRLETALKATATRIPHQPPAPESKIR